MKSRLAQTFRKPFARRDPRDNAIEPAGLPSASGIGPSRPDTAARSQSLFSNENESTPSLHDRQLDAILATLDASATSVMTAPNLSSIYDQLDTLQKELQPKWRGSVLSFQSNTMNRLARLDTAVDRFTVVFGQAAAQCLEQALNDELESVLQLCRIASHGAESTNAAAAARKRPVFSRSSSHTTIAQVNRYRVVLMTRLQESAIARFNNSYEQTKQDAALVLQNTGWAQRELDKLHRDVVPHLPNHWDMASFFQQAYRQGITETIRRLVDDNPDPKFFEFLAGELKQRSSQELFNGAYDILVQQSASSIVRRLEEWCTNLMNDEVKTFTTRDVEPETDADGQYSLHGAIILAQIINQHADFALECADRAVFVQVAIESVDVLLRMQTRWISVLDAEFVRSTTEPDTPGGLMEYADALANDQIRSADFVSAFQSRHASHLSTDLLAAHFAQLRAGYTTVAHHCTRLVVQLIMHDVKPAAKLLFNGAWLDGAGSLPQILETARDYLDECAVTLHPTFFAQLSRETLNETLVAYLHRLIRAKKLKIPRAVELVRDDVESIRQRFASWIPHDELEHRIGVMDHVVGMLGVSKNLVFLEFWRFAKAHGPNLGFVEALLKTRDDLDWMDVNKIMQALKKKLEAEPVVDDGASIVKRVKLPRTLLTSRAASP